MFLISVRNQINNLNMGLDYVLKNNFKKFLRFYCNFLFCIFSHLFVVI